MVLSILCIILLCLCGVTFRLCSHFSPFPAFTKGTHSVLGFIRNILHTPLIVLLLHNPPISSSTFPSPCGRLVAVPAVVQLDARGREGERGGKKIEMKLVFSVSWLISLQLS